MRNHDIIKSAIEGLLAIIESDDAGISPRALIRESAQDMQLIFGCRNQRPELQGLILAMPNGSEIQIAGGRIRGFYKGASYESPCDDRMGLIAAMGEAFHD